MTLTRAVFRNSYLIVMIIFGSKKPHIKTTAITLLTPNTFVIDRTTAAANYCSRSIDRPTKLTDRIQNETKMWSMLCANNHTIWLYTSLPPIVTLRVNTLSVLGRQYLCWPYTINSLTISYYHVCNKRCVWWWRSRRRRLILCPIERDVQIHINAISTQVSNVRDERTRTSFSASSINNACKLICLVVK